MQHGGGRQESLLNDGTAIVVFELCHMILVHPGTVVDYVTKGLSLVLGAPCLGSVGPSRYSLISRDLVRVRAPYPRPQPARSRQ